MGNPVFFVDTAPFLAGTGVTIDAVGNATVTGSASLFSKPFKINAKTSFSFFVQSAGGSTGVGTAGFRIQAANWDQDSKGASGPAVWTDVTADYGSAGAATPPSVRNFSAPFSGSTFDHFASWVCPYAFIRFTLVQVSGTSTYSGQFYCGEV